MFTGDVLSLVIGTALGFVDLFNMSIMKNISLGWLGIKWMTIPTAIYVLEPWLFYFGLANKATMTVLNLTWDLTSDILVTLIALFYFKEHVSYIKLSAIFFAFCSISLFAYDSIHGGTKLPTLIK
jgi:hypothetical protein